MQIKDIILVSDLDGTLIPITGTISRKNLDAINKFRKLGGTFTVATGRSPIQAKRYLDILKIDSPIISNNGAVIYGPKSDEIIWVKNMNLSYKDVVNDVKNNFPNVGIITISGKDKYKLIVSNKLIEFYQEYENVGYEISADGICPDECCKVLFAVDGDDRRELSTYLLYKGYNDVDFVLSGSECLEMMSSGISKGYALEKLVEIYGKSLHTTVAVGDYNNDVEMIKKANIGVAVSNAVEEAKEAADIVVADCEDDGIAELIEHLINQFG